MKLIRSKSTRRVLIIDDQKILEFRARAYSLFKEGKHLVKIRVIIDGSALPAIWSVKFPGIPRGYDLALFELRQFLRIVRDMLLLNDSFAADFLDNLKGYIPSTFYEANFTEESLKEFIEALTYYSSMIRQANVVRLSILAMFPFHKRETLIETVAQELLTLIHSTSRFAVCAFVTQPDVSTRCFETESFEKFREFVCGCVTPNHKKALEVI